MIPILIGVLAGMVIGGLAVFGYFVWVLRSAMR